MKNTRDHAEIQDVRNTLGLDEKAVPKRERWSTVGLGQGLGRKLSERRRSWGGSRSRSRNTEVGKGSPPRSTMKEVAEEGNNEDTQEDALAKLTGNAYGHANGNVTDEIMGNGALMDEKSVNSVPSALVNGTADGHVVA